jgi:hypothetical protein
MLHLPLPLRCLLVLMTLGLLAGCEALAEVNLPRPTPVPLLARLPTVTMLPPTPTPLPPSPTATPPAPDPTAEPVPATVRVGANVRSGPGLDFEIVGTVWEGSEVLLLGVSDDWYMVRVSEELSGWMINEVLLLPEAIENLVPTVQPAP